MTLRQISTEVENKSQQIIESYRGELIDILSGDLDFHAEKSNGSSHSFHSFPAKFPPQLPRKIINALTEKNEIVLDPMIGSGTTLIEAVLAERRGIGFDIDPLALKISSVKVQSLDVDIVRVLARKILKNAKKAIEKNPQLSLDVFLSRWDSKTAKFVDYWFDKKAQLELAALMLEIEKITDVDLHSFFELVFSSVIVTKSGGVSMALDLGHTRPHRAKIVLDLDGKIIHEEKVKEKRRPYVTKRLRSTFDEFGKRCEANMRNLLDMSSKGYVSFGNAESIPLADNSVDLIVTSPPYASNAIDYMRAHKFSLVWMWYSVEELGNKRKEYIGGDATSNITFETLPPKTSDLLEQISVKDKKKGLVVHRYYSEMTRVLKDTFRVLKSGKAALFVVGSSIIRGVDTETHLCLSEIGETIGFEVPKIGVRNLDRNRRMLPAGAKVNKASQIQQRMHKEYVIGFYKP